jgi:filamentous hemagglutinin family protein
MRQDQSWLMSRAAMAGISICVLASGSLIANPGEDDVDETYGDVEFGWEDGYLTIYASDGSIIDWFDFNIGEGETVEFILPGLDARVLNRILSGVPTEIMGNLLANGQVYIANPSGVIFGNGAVVNVGALYAAAGNISNDDFIAGVNRFTDARGVVENRGLLQGDLIALVGGRVANHGTISAPMGTVVLAAGEQVLIGEHLGNIYVQLLKPTDLDSTPLLSDAGETGLDLAAGDVFSLAAWNTGTIDAGNVQMQAGSGIVLVSGSVNAQMGDLGGEISFIGQDVVISGAEINASGEAGGGSLLIDGETVVIQDRFLDGTETGSVSAGQIEVNVSGSKPLVLGMDLLATDGGVVVNGDTILSDDVSITSHGDDAGIEMNGMINSMNGRHYNLSLNAAGGVVNLAGPVGTRREGSRLGILEVNARLARVGADIYVRDQMNWFAPVAVYGESVTFHAGDGTALFADDIYSEEIGMSDVSFLYDGIAFAGDGYARTPFKFRGNIGIGPEIQPFGAFGGAFGNIRFGDDLGSPSSASGFMFADGALAGLDLMSGGDVNLNTLFRIAARESVVMGRGQKMLSFGSLSLSAKGPGTTLVELGDMNILGDLLVTSLGTDGGEIHLLGRIGSLVDSQDSEGDRKNGTIDEGSEIIVMGSLTMLGDVSVDGGIARIGADEVRIANNDGTGEIAGIEIELFPGGVSLDLFRGVLEGSGAGVLYPYDLFLLSGSDDPTTELSSTFFGEDQIELRDDPALIAGRQILTELSMNPHDPASRVLHNEQTSGGAMYDAG